MLGPQVVQDPRQVVLDAGVEALGLAGAADRGAVANHTHCVESTPFSHD